MLLILAEVYHAQPPFAFDEHQKARQSKISWYDGSRSPERFPDSSDDVGYEALPLLHIAAVRLANCFEQNALLDSDAVAVSRDCRDR